MRDLSEGQVSRGGGQPAVEEVEVEGVGLLGTVYHVNWDGYLAPVIVAHGEDEDEEDGCVEERGQEEAILEDLMGVFVL